MPKLKRIMSIPELEENIINGTGIAIDICNIKHSPIHCHESLLELVFCLSGSVSLRCNQDLVTLNAGDMYCLGLEDIHCLYSDTDNITVIFHIDMHKANLPWDTIRSSYFSIENNNLEPYQVRPLRKIKDLLLSILYSYVKNGTLDFKDTDFFIPKTVSILIKYFDWNSQFILSENIDDELRQRLRSIVKYCGTNYMNKLTISQLAAELHINENYFSQFMKKSGYRSFSDLVGYLRCFYAQFMLLEGEMSIIQIADKVGFSDVKYFYKYFKRIWQQTPTEFRQWFEDYIKEDDCIAYYSSDDFLPLLKDYIVEDFTSNMLSAK